MKYVERLNRRDYLVTSIDSCKCLNVKSLYHQLKSAFDFPDYSGNNYNEIINDYISDLGWFEEKNFKLLVTNMSKFNKYQHSEKALLMDKLDYISQHWKWKKEALGNRYENDFIIEFVN